MVLATLRSPDAFGELSAVDGRPRSASATTLEPTTLVAVDRATLLDAVHHHPGVADGMLSALGGLARRITEQTSDLVFLDLAGRLAKTLATLADRDGTAEGDTVVLELPLTQTELAEMVGGSRQSVRSMQIALTAWCWWVLSAGSSNRRICGVFWNWRMLASCNKASVLT